MKIRDLFTAYLDTSLRARKNDARLFTVRQREEQESLRRDIQLLTRLLAAARRLSENATTSAPKMAARLERDRQRQSRIQTTFASADRRIAALKAQKAAAKPSGPMDAEKAQKEAERVRKLDARAADIRASANAKASDLRS